MIQVFFFLISLSHWKNRGATDQNDDKIWRRIFVKSRGFFFCFFVHFKFEILFMSGDII